MKLSPQHLGLPRLRDPGMGSGSWLRLLLALGALWGLGARETVRGILGQATRLHIPQEFQAHTQKFGEATWKKVLDGQQKKRFLLNLSRGSYVELDRDRVRFHSEDFSLEILNTSRDDERLYEYSVSMGKEEEKVWEIQLEVYEPVAHPEIRVLHRELSNGNCSLALLCSSETGDKVSYIWDSRDIKDIHSIRDTKDTGNYWDIWNPGDGICSGHGALLNVSFPLRGEASRCVCTARNPVGSRSAAFNISRCGLGDSGDPGMSPGLVVLLVALGLIVVILVVIVTFRATRWATAPTGDQDPSQAAPDSASATIYAQVQKPKGTVPEATPGSCTTVYAAATGPLPAPDRAPRSPAGSPTPRGRSPLSQEPTTVYAGVTLPVA